MVTILYEIEIHVFFSVALAIQFNACFKIFYRDFLS